MQERFSIELHNLHAWQLHDRRPHIQIPKQYTMLCNICRTVTPKILLFKLHKRWKNGVSSAASGCCVCKWMISDEQISETSTSFVETEWNLGSGKHSRCLLSRQIEIGHQHRLINPTGKFYWICQIFRVRLLRSAQPSHQTSSTFDEGTENAPFPSQRSQICSHCTLIPR